MPDHKPSREKPWVRVKDADGHEFDRAYFDPGIEDGSFAVIEDYPVNDSPYARPHKYRTEKDGTPALDARGAELAALLDEAGLTEETKGMTADEKRQRLAEHEAADLTGD